VSVDNVRRIILEQSKRANVGHIGCALSVADIVTSVYDFGLRERTGDANDRDRFVLSKGHAALALYACLHAKGRLSREQIDTYCADNTLLGVHPEHALEGVDFCTGSLGQGLSMAAGAALAARLQHSTRRVYALLSDAECNEGSVWEAAMFAAHFRLRRLMAVIDYNKLQSLTGTEQTIGLEPFEDKWRAFGWEVRRCDGHDHAALAATFGRPAGGDRPVVVICDTTKGKGVSFMENSVLWHYRAASEDELAQALRELDVR